MTKRKPKSVFNANRVSYVPKDMTKNVFEMSLERLYGLFARFPHVSVGFSSGKDSTVLLNLTYLVASDLQRPFTVICIDEEIIDPDTLAYTERTIARFKDDPLVTFKLVCLPIRHTLRSSLRFYWMPWDPDYRDVWYRDIPPGAITVEDYPEHANLKQPNINDIMRMLHMDKIQAGEDVLTLSAVRAAESPNRRRAIFSFGTWINHRNDNYFYAKPIYDWSATDIWYAIGKFGFDYSGFYDRMTSEGIPIHLQRIGPMGVAAATKTVHLWRKFFPIEFSKAVRRLPEIKSMADFGRTTVFNNNEKPAELTWMEWTFKILESLDEASQDYWLGQIESVLNRWKTTHVEDLPDEPLKQSDGSFISGGASWKVLSSIVSKNDRSPGGGSRDLNF